MSATVKGMTEIRRKLRAFEREARSPVRRGLERAAINVQSRAKQNAPTHFGRLRSAIQTAYDPQTQSAIVGVAVHYAKYVEFGVGPAGARSEHNQLARRWMQEAGYVHGADGPFPPLDIIKRWVHLNGIAEGDDVEEVAFLIARSISINGIAAQPFLFPALAAVIPQIPRYVEREIARTLRG